MKSVMMALALVLANTASASDPDDFARQWPVLGHCGPGVGPIGVAEQLVPQQEPPAHVMLRQGAAGSQTSLALHSVPGRQRPEAPHETASPLRMPGVPLVTQALVMKSQVVPKEHGMAAGFAHSLRQAPSWQVCPAVQAQAASTSTAASGRAASGLMTQMRSTQLLPGAHSALVVHPEGVGAGHPTRFATAKTKEKRRNVAFIRRWLHLPTTPDE